ncbi:MAG TPA: YihY/virulence factor BrkB family protein [Rhizomicrobium sp.]
MRVLWSARRERAGQRVGENLGAPRNARSQEISPQRPQGPFAIALALYRASSNDRIFAISAGVTFFVLLAAFPAIAALVSVYGLIADARSIAEHLANLSAVFPAGALEIIGEQVKHVAAAGQSRLGLAFAGGLLAAVWSANAGMKALFDALNIVLNEKETRGFLRLNAVSLAMTGGFLIFVLAALAAMLLLPLVTIGLDRPFATLLDIARWPALWLLLTLAIAFLYRFGPARRDVPWRWISWGSASASVLWIGVSMLFSYYAANFGSYNKTYGSLGAAVGFMTWIWLSMILILTGAELNEILGRGRCPPNTNGRPPLAAPPAASL